jgi:hypothetical protein
MKSTLNKTHLTRLACTSLAPVVAVLLFTGCRSSKDACCSTTPEPAATKAAPVVESKPASPAPAPAAEAKPANPVPAAAIAAANPAPAVIRIRFGDTVPFTDSAGNVWLADQGFADGDTVERDPELKIENTKDPGLYRKERYGMSSFSWPMANGKYTVKLHFAETFEGITGPGERIFSFNVEGQEFKDVDLWVKAGGSYRAYVETVKVDITDGKLDIKFTSKVENPEINGIEILPGS